MLHRTPAIGGESFGQFTRMIIPINWVNLLGASLSLHRQLAWREIMLAMEIDQASLNWNTIGKGDPDDS